MSVKGSGLERWKLTTQNISVTNVLELAPPWPFAVFVLFFHAKSSNLFMGSAQFHVEWILYWTQLLIAEQRPALSALSMELSNKQQYYEGRAVRCRSGK